MKFSWALIFLLTFACFAYAKESDFLDFRHITRSNFGNFFPNDRLTFEKIKTFPVKNYEEFLAHLYKTKPAFYENEVLIHRSGSLQLASLSSPRVILFGEGLIFSFADHDQSHEDGQRVEIFEFDNNSMQFLPREIIFNSEGIIYKDQPTSCLSCHGDPIKPIWMPYDFWPSAYGSHIGRSGSLAETDAYLHAFNRNADQGVFQYLQPVKEQENRSLYPKSIEAFSVYVTQLNNLKIANILKEKNLGPFLYPLYFALTDCHIHGYNFLSLFPESLLKKLPITFVDILNDTKKSRAWLKSYLDQIYLEIFSEFQPIAFLDHNRLSDEQDIVAMMRFILENNGISLRSLLLNRGINDYFFSSPSNFSFDLAEVLLDVIGGEFAKTIKESTNYCRDAKQITHQAFERSPNFQRPFVRIKFNKSGKDLPVVGRCIKCHSLSYHSDHPSAPYIPFENSSKLKKALQTTNLAAEISDRIHRVGRGQMPPRQALSEEEKASLQEVIQELSRH